MKRLLRNPKNKKQNFSEFAKLTAFELVCIKGGTEDTPPEELEEDTNQN